jgi:isopenicillin N synthase-like dioxygenase
MRATFPRAHRVPATRRRRAEFLPKADEEFPVELPAIDLETLEHGVDGNEPARLAAAMRELGAFRLTGHGVDPRTTDALLAESRRFFSLPQAERDRIDMICSPYFRGYSAAGSERTQGEPDLREQLDVGPEETPQPVASGDPAYLRLHGPNLWPAAQPELRPVVLGWMECLRDVSTRLMAEIVASIGMPRTTLAAGFSGQPHERLKIIKYPPAPANAQGVGEHSDSGFLALIVQDGTRGLQVHDGNGYIDVVAEAGDMIVVAGRALSTATAGDITAARHRVTSPPAGRERVSVAYFLNPRLDYDGYGEEALKVVLRSHPETAQRYFADLLAL